MRRLDCRLRIQKVYITMSYIDVYIFIVSPSHKPREMRLFSYSSSKYNEKMLFMPHTQHYSDDNNLTYSSPHATNYSI